MAAGTAALLRRRREAQRLVKAEAEATAQAAEERQAVARRAPTGRQRRAKRPQ